VFYRALLAHKALKDRKAILVQQVLKVHKVLQVLKAHKEFPALKVHKVLPELGWLPEPICSWKKARQHPLISSC
jgi:hypothetical protein